MRRRKDKIFNISKEILWYSVLNLSKIESISEEAVCCFVSKILNIDWICLDTDLIVRISTLQIPETFLWLRRISLQSRLKILELSMWYYRTSVIVEKGLSERVG